LAFPRIALGEQTHSIESVKAAYVFNFLKYIEWPNEDSLEAIRIGFIGSDEAYLEQVLKIQDKTVRSKQIVVHAIKKPRDIDNYQVIIAARDVSQKIKEISRKLFGKSTLFITDDIQDKQLTMLNFIYPSPELVRFEVNRYNLIYEKLKISPDIVVMGGTELDVAELIKDMDKELAVSQNALREQSLRLEEVSNEVSSKQNQINKQSQDLVRLKQEASNRQSQLEAQADLIADQTLTLTKQKKELLETKASLETFQSELLSLDVALEDTAEKLSTKRNEIASKESSIAYLSALIEKNKTLLEEQKARIDEQASSLSKREMDIQDRDKAIETQSSQLKTQYYALVSSVIILIFIGIITYTLLRSGRVKQRANKKLEQANQLLRDTQAQLVESEKMASLGNLVAGVAHEINTPLGVGVTAATHLDERLKEFSKHYESGQLKRSELDDLLSNAHQSTEILKRNLTRASELVGNFKQVSADQMEDELRDFELTHYLEEVCQSLYPQLRQGGHQINIAYDQHVPMQSFPGSIAQVISNLIMNSQLHGFENKRRGTISIEVEVHGSRVNIHYKDDGEGIPEGIRDKIFEPFVTSKRGKGGTGLGMHICYNQVNQRLGGTITCLEAATGSYFLIDIPTHIKNLSDEADPEDI
jgi:signal transduction histidine kinase